MSSSINICIKKFKMFSIFLFIINVWKVYVLNVSCDRNLILACHALGFFWMFWCFKSCLLGCDGDMILLSPFTVLLHWAVFYEISSAFVFFWRTMPGSLGMRKRSVVRFLSISPVNVTVSQSGSWRTPCDGSMELISFWELEFRSVTAFSCSEIFSFAAA